jgi:hypothetical protein
MWNPLINTGDAGIQILAAYTDRRSYVACSGWQVRTPNATSSGPTWIVSTSTPPRAMHPRHTA